MQYIQQMPLSHRAGASRKGSMPRDYQNMVLTMVGHASYSHMLLALVTCRYHSRRPLDSRNSQKCSCTAKCWLLLKKWHPSV